MNEQELDLIELAVAAAIPLPPAPDVSPEAAAQFLIGMLDEDGEREVLDSCIAHDECDQILSDCAKELDTLEGKADHELKAATLDGGCRAETARVLLEVREARSKVAGEQGLTFRSLMVGLRDSILNSGHVRAILASRDFPPTTAAYRSTGVRPVRSELVNGQLSVELGDEGVQKIGRLIIIPGRVEVAAVDTMASSIEVDLSESPEVRNRIIDKDGGLELAFVRAE